MLNRVGYLDANGVKVKVIGDVHLGRRFITGVPLHRRGEREKMVMDQFERELINLDDDTRAVVQVGDVFDKFVVSNEVLEWTARTIWAAAEDHPKTTFVFMRGNHDAQRDLEKVSSFDLLQELREGLRNVDFAAGHPWSTVVDGRARLGFCPWHAVKTAAEQAEALIEMEDHFDIVFGHWDMKAFGDDTHNLIPDKLLEPYVSLLVTGHDHRPREVGKTVVVGSMQPYAHGEENPQVDDLLYMDLSLQALETIKIDLKHKCVRVFLSAGETLPADIDCLQLTAKRITAAGEEDVEVELGSFDMEALFKRAFVDEGVDEAVGEEMFGKFREARAA